jgi:hypothetical protein
MYECMCACKVRPYICVYVSVVCMQLFENVCLCHLRVICQKLSQSSSLYLSPGSCVVVVELVCVHPDTIQSNKVDLYVYIVCVVVRVCVRARMCVVCV